MRIYFSQSSKFKYDKFDNEKNIISQPNERILLKTQNYLNEVFIINASVHKTLSKWVLFFIFFCYIVLFLPIYYFCLFETPRTDFFDESCGGVFFLIAMYVYCLFNFKRICLCASYVLTWFTYNSGQAKIIVETKWIHSSNLFQKNE